MSVTVARIDLYTWQLKHLDLALYVMQSHGPSLVWDWITHVTVGDFLYPEWAFRASPTLLKVFDLFLSWSCSINICILEESIFHKSLTLILGVFISMHELLSHTLNSDHSFLFSFGSSCCPISLLFFPQKSLPTPWIPWESTSWAFLVLHSEAALVAWHRAGVVL